MRSYFLSRGFTLIESLVAISVLLVGVVAPLSIVSQSIFTANIARDQIIAFYLANEGVEMVKNIRDSNVLVNSTWLTGLDSCMGGGKCTVDGKTALVAACPTVGLEVVCPFLNIVTETDTLPDPDVTRLFYGYESGKSTTFVRSITIVETVLGKEAKVNVTVGWKTGALERSFTASSVMMKWY